ncbi:hypothetical protein CDCA_CDCA16G4267 [Cyanidium caldarium]|uniref:SRP54-type proteins GTP-binding domain-containing protein n=1 Tax=Cyanidium caldarium TaxID=2771 RepID=A0AAV9J0X5_CYACA|nr:hypothetical protein CDCA_CDCA16G4267 [Cyanidium caldarium]
MFVPALGCHNRWGTRAINSATHACPRRFPHSSQLSRVRCMAGAFDWLRSWGERASKESAALGDALKQGRLGEYVRDKAKRDVAEVQAFQQGLMKSRERLGREIETIMERNAGKLDEMEATLRELEEALLMADLGVSVVDRVMEDLRREATEQRLRSAADIREALAASLVRILVQVEPDTGDKKAVGSTTAPAVVLLVGSNGHGKTTTAAKLAHRLRTQAQQRVLLAACDTFRAAAVDQLELWAERAGVDLVKPRPNQKSGTAVAFDAIERAKSDRYDAVVMDTSGRLHTNQNLMTEMQKLKRVVERQLQGEIAECLLVVDASTGRNAIPTAKRWREAMNITGVVVTKLDGTARAGFVVGLASELGIPVRFVGIGERLEDLRDFDPTAFVSGLLLGERATSVGASKA